MASLTEGTHAGEFLLSESPGTQSRENGTVTVPANTTLADGTVLAQLSADDTYVEYDDVGTDGSEAAAGILYGPLVNDTDAPVDMDGVVIDWGAEVRKAALAWKTGVSAGSKTNAYADLAARGVKARD